MKKLISMLMAVAMVAAMSVSVFAADPAPTTYTGNGEVALPVINVTLSGTSGKIFLNPNGFTLMKADASAIAVGERVDASLTTSDPVFSAPVVIRNGTSMDLDIYVVAKGTGLDLVAADDKGDLANEAGKKLYLYADFGEVGGTEDVPTVTTGYKLEILNTDTANGGKKVGKLVASTADNWAGTGKLGMQFGGELAKKVPATGNTAWSANDKVTVTLTFTFVASTSATNGAELTPAASGGSSTPSTPSTT